MGRRIYAHNADGTPNLEAHALLGLPLRGPDPAPAALPAPEPVTAPLSLPIPTGSTGTQPLVIVVPISLPTPTAPLVSPTAPPPAPAPTTPAWQWLALGLVVVVAVMMLTLITRLDPSGPVAQARTQIRALLLTPAERPPVATEPTAEPTVTPEPPAVPAAGEHSVLGAPTISAATIDRVLADYGSPAEGTGQLWLDLGMQYGLDPAYALAFFIHESGAGTAAGWAGLKSDGTTTHNIGNIICAGYATCYGRFRDYADWRTGIEDWYRLIAVEYVEWRGVHTVEQIIPIYAPAFENDVGGYVEVVERLVNEWRTTEGTVDLRVVAVQRESGGAVIVRVEVTNRASTPLDGAALRVRWPDGTESPIPGAPAIPPGVTQVVEVGLPANAGEVLQIVAGSSAVDVIAP